MGDFQSIAQQFTQFYYTTFDENRSNLAALYLFSIRMKNTQLMKSDLQQRDQSMLTFESASVQGTSGIVDKLVNLPFQKVQHQISTLDAQPSNAEGGIIVMVTGALKVDDEERPMNYTQVFQLLPDGAGSYFVFNDMFKLIYG
ncbi:MAG: hypothetical protein Q9166_002470 [cf. Caloplaca sp. 2 TL-2023]